MEQNDTNVQNKKVFLEKYSYLEPLLKHYEIPYDRASLDMDDYIIILNKIVLKYIKTSEPEIIDNIKNFFFLLVKYSIRMNADNVLFKALSYFIQEGFNFFISSLKSDKIITLPEFIKQLFLKINEEKIAEYFAIDKLEVEKELKLNTLKKAIKEKKFKFKQKFGCYIFLFFRNFVEQNDKEITNELYKYIKEKDWVSFYEIYEKYKIYDDFDRKFNSIFHKNSSDKNEIMKNIIGNNQNIPNLIESSEQNILNILENQEVSQNNGQKNTEVNNPNNNQENIEINNENSKKIRTSYENSEQKNSDNKNSEIKNNDNEKNEIKNKQKITEMNNTNNIKEDNKIKNLNDTQKSTEMNYENKQCDNKIKVYTNEQLSEKLDQVTENYNKLTEKFNKFMELFKKHRNDSDNEINSLKEKINVLSSKLDLSILINNLSTQRDSYRKTLEILLKFLNNELKLNLVFIGDDIWKQTKIAINKIHECEINEENRECIINALEGLLFCKDYANCLTHGKGSASEEIDKYYQNKNETQIIATASYKNMKNVTKMFFTEKVNKGEFKIINNILFQKIEKWKSVNEIDYSKYMSKNELNHEILLKHFSFAENIIEKFALKDEIDNSLLYN